MLEHHLRPLSKIDLTGSAANDLPVEIAVSLLIGRICLAHSHTHHSVPVIAHNSALPTSVNS